MANCSRFSVRWDMGRIVDFGFWILDFQYSGAAIVGGGDEGAGARRIGGGGHGAGDFFGRAKGDGTNGGTGAAEESAESAGGYGGGDDVVEEWDQFFPKRLMEMIHEGAA